MDGVDDVWSATLVYAIIVKFNWKKIMAFHMDPIARMINATISVQNIAVRKVVMLRRVK
jgi:hypothetical protein